MDFKAGLVGNGARHIGHLGARRLALASTPDLDLMVARFRPRDAALFRAGLELGILHYGLAFFAWLLQLGLIRSLSPFKRIFCVVADALTPFGTDRGGMIVEAAGRDAHGRPTISCWSLGAEAGDGPYVPTLPALALIRKLISDRATIPTGAYAGAGLLSLEVIGAEFARLRVRTEHKTVHPLAPFEAALARHFELLPDAVKAVHRAGPVTRLAGTARVEGAQSLIGALGARLFGFPTSSDRVLVQVVIRLAADGTETWERDFGGRRFRSRLAPLRRDMVSERFGPFTFDLALEAATDGLTMHVVDWRFGMLPLPRWLAPKSKAVESSDAEGQFCFDVPIALPFVGSLVRYRGSLAPVP